MKLLNLKINISTPWEYFRNLGCLHFKLTKNKACELEYTFYAGTLVELDVNYGIREDHAGFEFIIGLLGYIVRFHIYDTRHWNYETNDWEHYVI
jgi:hypothetical protein